MFELIAGIDENLFLFLQLADELFHSRQFFWQMTIHWPAIACYVPASPLRAAVPKVAERGVPDPAMRAVRSASARGGPVPSVGSGDAGQSDRPEIITRLPWPKSESERVPSKEENRFPEKTDPNPKQEELLGQPPGELFDRRGFPVRVKQPDAHHRLEDRFPGRTRHPESTLREKKTV